jgi:hypothetical protein
MRCWKVNPMPWNRLKTPASDADYLSSARFKMMASRGRMTANYAGDRSRNRIVEWLCGAMLINFSFISLLSPDTLAAGSFKYITVLEVTPNIFGWSCGIVGVVRCLALYYNGWGLPWSARVRALCAIFGAAVFGVLGLSLVYLTRDTGTLSLGIGTHFLLALVELYSCLRAGADVVEGTRRGVMHRTIQDCVDRGDTNATT